MRLIFKPVRAFLFILSVFSFLAAHAKVAQLHPVKMVLQDGDRVEVRGYRGRVELITVPSAKDVTVHVEQVLPDEIAPEDQALFDEWQFQLRRENGAVLIAVDGPVTKELWNRTLISNIAPEYRLRVHLPSVPVEVNWGEGVIISKDHHSSLRITQTQGEVHVTGGEGELRISNQEGAVEVRGRKGSVDIDAYQAKINVADVNGRVRVENFTGETKIEKAEGELALSSFRGVSKVMSARGKLDFRNGNSPLHIDNFQGELRGKSLQGPVFAAIQGDANVKVTSQEGPVHLRLPNSGAWVNLGTVDGSLFVPSFLKLTRLPNQQIRTGRLRGNSGGSVFVRTVSGDVRVR